MIEAVPATASTLALVRAATRAKHDALDASVDVSSLANYRRFLVASHAAVSGLEQALGYNMERSVALGLDLDELGEAHPASIAISFGSRSATLGGAYVLEGSSLGGLVLAERVAPFSSATRYLRLHGKATAQNWREFLQRFERDVTARDECVAGAVQAFDHYDRAFRMHGARS